MFIMERTWGTVAAALTSGPLALETTDSIAVQVASALSYMQEMRISHGGLGIRSVFLVQQPRFASPVTAKLANFESAKLDVTDPSVLAEDTLRLGVFLYNPEYIRHA